VRNELEKLFRHSLVFLVGLVFQRAARFFLLPLYWSAFPPERFGLLDLFEVFIQVMVLTFSFALPTAYIKFYRVDVREGVGEEALRGTVAALLAGGLGLLVVALVLLEGPLSWLFFKGEHPRLYAIAGGAVAANIAFLMVQSGLRARGRAVAFVLVSSVQFLMLMGFNIYFVAWCGMGVAGVLWSSLLGWGVPAAVYALAALRGFRPRFDGRLARRLIGFSAPLVPYSLVAFFLMVSGRIFLQHFQGPGAVGIFSAANRVALILMLVCVTPFQTAWGYLGLDFLRRDDAPELFSRMFSYLLAWGLWAFLLVLSVGREMILVFGKERYAPALPYVGPLMAGYLMLLFFYWANIALVGRDMTVRVLLNSLPALAVALVGGWLVVPRFGIEGAIGVFVGAMAVHAAITAAWGKKLVGFRLERLRVLKVLGAFALAWLAGGVFAKLLPGWRLGAAVLELAAFPALLWAGGFLTPGEAERLRDLGRFFVGASSGK